MTAETFTSGIPTKAERTEILRQAHMPQLQFEADEVTRTNGKIPSTPDLTHITAPEPGVVTGTVKDTGTGAQEWRSPFSIPEPIIAEKIHWNKELILKAITYGFKSWVGRYDPRGKSKRWYVETGAGIGASILAENFIGLGTSKALKAAIGFGAAEVILYANSRKMVNRELEAIKNLNGDEMDKKLRELLDERKATEIQLRTTLRNLVSGASLGFAVQGIAFGMLEGVQSLSQISAEATNNIEQAKDGLLSNFNHSAVESDVIADPTKAGATAQVVSAPAIAVIDPEVTQHINPHTDFSPEGYQMTKVTFPKPEGQIDDQPISLRGEMQAKIIQDEYKIGTIDPEDGVLKFDPKNYDHLIKAQAEIANDEQYQNKVAAGMNYFMHLNQELKDAGAFTNVKGIVGETIQGYDDQGVLVEYHKLTDQEWNNFFESDEWKNWITQSDTNIVAENPLAKAYNWREGGFHFSQPDTEFSKPEWTVEKLGLQGTHLQPGDVHSGAGLAKSLEAQDYDHIKSSISSGHYASRHFNANDSTQADSYLQAISEDPLHTVREQIIEDQIRADAPNAFLKTVDAESGQKMTTDLIAGVQPDGSPTHLALFEDYNRLAKTLVNESPSSKAFDGYDAWVKFDPSSEGLVTHLYNGDHVYTVNDFIDAAIKKYDLGDLTDAEKAALIRWAQENEPENYFANPEKTLLRLYSPATGHVYEDKLPRADILKRILANLKAKV